LTTEERDAVEVGKPVTKGAVVPPVVAVDGLDGAALPVALHARGRLVAIATQDGDLLRPSKVFHEI
jgi:hypothetical protein